MESIVPSLSRVEINVPSTSVLGLGPVRNRESLEDSSWLSVHLGGSDSFKKSVWMEVLSVDVEVEVRLFEELLVVCVFNSVS